MEKFLETEEASRRDDSTKIKMLDDPWSVPSLITATSPWVVVQEKLPGAVGFTEISATAVRTLWLDMHYVKPSTTAS